MAFGGILRQSTAVDVLIGPFVDSTDGDAEETGLTIAQADVRLSKNGQTAAQKNDNTTCAHDADGFYNCELDATDTNTVGQLVLYVHVAGALAVRHDFQIVEEAVYDALYAASAVGPLLANSNGSGLTEAGGTGDHLTAVPWNSAWDAEVQSEVADALAVYDPPTNAEMEARTLAAASYATAANQTTIIADTNELQTDWADGGRLDLILDARASQATADAVEADTQNIQSRLPAALNNGCMPADIQRINDVEITGDGQSGTEFGVA